MAAAAGDLRQGGPLRRGLRQRRDHARARGAVPAGGAQQPRVGAQQPALRARERARGARPHLARDVGVRERALAAQPGPPGAPAGARARRRALPLPAQRGGSLPRQHLEHDDARRSVRLLPARLLSRARGHDRAHHGREVPPAAAGPEPGRLAARLLPVGGAAEVDVGLRGVPAPLPVAATARRGGVRGPRRRLPALAALRRRPHGPGAGADRLGARRLALRARGGRALRAGSPRAAAQRSSKPGSTSSWRASSAGVSSLHDALQREYFEAHLGDAACAT